MSSFITDLLNADLGARFRSSGLASVDEACETEGPSFLESSGVVSHHAQWGRHVMLRPGDWLFGRGSLRGSATLGASLALIIWLPRLRLGGMCCFSHPERPGGVFGLEGASGLYGADAVRWLDERLSRTACDWSDVVLSLVGGAQQHGGGAGEINVRWAQDWTRTLNLSPVLQDVGGSALRKLDFNLQDGSVSVVAHRGGLQDGTANWRGGS